MSEATGIVAMTSSRRHCRMVLSREEETKRKGRSGCEPRPYTSAWWSATTRTHSPERKSHTRIVASQEPVTTIHGISECQISARTFCVSVESSLMSSR